MRQRALSRCSITSSGRWITESRTSETSADWGEPDAKSTARGRTVPVGPTRSILSGPQPRGLVDAEARVRSAETRDVIGCEPVSQRGDPPSIATEGSPRTGPSITSGPVGSGRGESGRAIGKREEGDPHVGAARACRYALALAEIAHFGPTAVRMQAGAAWSARIRRTHLPIGSTISTGCSPRGRGGSRHAGHFGPDPGASGAD
jgi:hypothetical protein